ncbi:MAG: hypothetical protein ACKOJ9_09170 [Actinomycetota bacterium]
MTETTKSIVDIHDESGPLDVSREFEILKAGVSSMFERITARIPVQPDPSTDRFADYGGGGGPRGSLNAFVGPDVDWMIHSWIGNPTIGFTNLHLTVYLGPHTWVPHLGIALGTIPDYWYFVDYVPRVDLLARPDYLDRYYEPQNAEYMAIREDPNFSPFVSQTLYIRQAVSNTALCCVVKRNDDAVQKMLDMANRRVDEWLAHLDAGDPVAPADRAALMDRDLLLRRTVADRDPANVIGERFFGKEMTEALVRALWGGDRVLPRPDGSRGTIG